MIPAFEMEICYLMTSWMAIWKNRKCTKNHLICNWVMHDCFYEISVSEETHTDGLEANVGNRKEANRDLIS